MAKSKDPKAAKQLYVEKKPKIAIDPDVFYEQSPSWRIRRIKMVDPHGWHVLDSSTVGYIREKLSSFETMTWSQILVVAKKHNHLIAVSEICREAQEHLAEINMEDIDEVLSLRLSSRERVWGVLDRGVVELLWWDPEHSICPSPLKNT